MFLCNKKRNKNTDFENYFGDGTVKFMGHEFWCKCGALMIV